MPVGFTQLTIAAPVALARMSGADPAPPVLPSGTGGCQAPVAGVPVRAVTVPSAAVYTTSARPLLSRATFANRPKLLTASARVAGALHVAVRASR